MSDEDVQSAADVPAPDDDTADDDSEEGGGFYYDAGIEHVEAINAYLTEVFLDEENGDMEIFEESLPKTPAERDAIVSLLEEMVSDLREMAFEEEDEVTDRTVVDSSEDH